MTSTNEQRTTPTHDLRARDQALRKADQAAGLGLLIGGPVLAFTYLFHPDTAPPETVASVSWIVVHVGFMLSLLAGVFGLMALLAGYFRRGGGVSGLVGFVMGVVSLVFVFGLDYAEVFIFPILAMEFPEVIIKYGDGTMMPSIAFVFPLTGILFVAGLLLLSLELWKIKAAPAAACIVTMIGVVVFGVGLSGLTPMFVVRLGASLFGLGLVLLGWAIRNGRAPGLLSPGESFDGVCHRRTPALGASRCHQALCTPISVPR